MGLESFSIFGSGGNLVQWSGTILAVLVQGHARDISEKYFEIGPFINFGTQGSFPWNILKSGY